MATIRLDNSAGTFTPRRRVRLRVQRRRTWWDRLLRRPARWRDHGTYDVERWAGEEAASRIHRLTNERPE